MEDVINALLSKADEVNSIVQSYSLEMNELEELVLKGEGQYSELVTHYKERLKELHPQLTQIRHAIFKLKEAQRLKQEADSMVEQIKRNFELDKQRKSELSIGGSSEIVFSGNKKLRF